MCKEGRRSGCGCGGSRAGGQLTAAGGLQVLRGRPPGSTSPPTRGQALRGPSPACPRIPCVRSYFLSGILFPGTGRGLGSGRGCLHVPSLKGAVGSTKEQHRVLFRPHVPSASRTQMPGNWSGGSHTAAREEGRGSKGRAVKKPVWSLLCRRSPAPPGLRRLDLRATFTVHHTP